MLRIRGPAGVEVPDGPLALNLVVIRRRGGCQNILETNWILWRRSWLLLDGVKAGACAAEDSVCYRRSGRAGWPAQIDLVGGKLQLL